MAKILIILSIILILPLQSQAIGVNAGKYLNNGGLYSGSRYPQSVANNTENITPEIDISKLKQGKASSRNFFWLVEVGDSSIEKAAKKANITKIHYVDIRLDKLYVPYLVIPIFAKQKTTIVYGE